MLVLVWLLCFFAFYKVFSLGEAICLVLLVLLVRWSLHLLRLWLVYHFYNYKYFHKWRQLLVNRKPTFDLARQCLSAWWDYVVYFCIVFHLSFSLLAVIMIYLYVTNHYVLGVFVSWPLFLVFIIFVSYLIMFLVLLISYLYFIVLYNDASYVRSLKFKFLRLRVRLLSLIRHSNTVLFLKVLLFSIVLGVAYYVCIYQFGLTNTQFFEGLFFLIFFMLGLHMWPEDDQK
jgi:hypothetical protein